MHVYLVTRLNPVICLRNYVCKCPTAACITTFQIALSAELSKSCLTAARAVEIGLREQKESWATQKYAVTKR